MSDVLAIATCHHYPALTDDDIPLVAALLAAGIPSQPVVWNADASWSSYSAVLLRSPWDYFQHAEAFSAWLDRLDREGVACWNPTSLVRWNLDKKYLRDLEAKGVLLLPTLWIDQGTPPEEAIARIADTGWADLVVKPTVSAGAWRTLRVRREEIRSQAPFLREILSESTLMAQPFAPEITRDGELSLLFFSGKYSHSVVKKAKSGDFRVQWTHGGTQEEYRAPASLITQAEAVLAAAPSAGLYARVDGILRDGRLVLMELEQIEPYLFFAQGPGSLDRFVAEVKARL